MGKKAAAKQSLQWASSVNLKKCNLCLELCDNQAAGWADAAKPRPITMARSKFARIHGLPSAGSLVAPEEEGKTRDPRNCAAVTKSFVSKLARIRSLPSATSPTAPKGEFTTQRRHNRAEEKKSVKLPNLHDLPPARSSPEMGRSAGNKDKAAAHPKSATMRQR